MKRFIFFAHVYTCFALIYPAALCAQNADTSFPNYVVIGAFAFQENAVHFTHEARLKKLAAQFELNPNRNLYYVYVLSTTDKEYAVSEALKLRSGTKYFDTWVYSGPLGNVDASSLSHGPGQDVDPVTGKPIEQIKDEQHESTQGVLPRIGRRTQGQSEQADRRSRIESSDTELRPDAQLADDSSLQANLSNKDSRRAGTSVKKVNEPTVTSNRNNLGDTSAEEIQGGTTDGTSVSDAAKPSLQTSKSNTNAVKKNTSSQKTGKGYTGQSAQNNEAQSPEQPDAEDIANVQNTLEQGGNKKAVSQASQQSQSHTPEGEKGDVPTNQQKSLAHNSYDAAAVESSQQSHLQKTDGRSSQEPAKQHNSVARNSDKNALQQSSAQTGAQKLDVQNTQQRTTQQNNVAQKTGNNEVVHSGQHQKQSASAQNQHQAANEQSAPAQKQNGQQTAISGNTPAQKQQTIAQEQSSRQTQQANGVPGTGQKPDQTVSTPQNGVVSGRSATAANIKSPASKDQTTTQNASTKVAAERKGVAATNANVEQSGENSAEGAGEVTAPIAPPVRQTTAPLTSEEVTGKNFYFHLYRADNLNTIPGEVEAIDFERSRKMATYAANEGVKVIMPSGKTKRISFVCQVFGYRKQQQEFDPSSPSEDLYLDEKGNLVVPFELVRLQKGDIAIMYNVFFFKDAAVMRPESRYEVNNLLDLLQENPSYKIKIHGHTNGNASGKIIRMDNNGNFYSLTGTKQGIGSAKQLSEDRALVIRQFLVSSGISADRMEVKAWGGKKPIHDKHSARAHENVRVEIEILSQ